LPYADRMAATLGKAYIEIVGDVSNFESGLRRQLTRIFAGVAGLGAAGAVAGKLFGLAGSLQQLAGAAVAVPAALSLAGASLTGLIVATQGFGDAIKGAFSNDAAKFQKALENLSPLAQKLAIELHGVVPELKGVKNAAQDALSGELLGQIKKTADALAGPLSAGLAKVAKQWGATGAQALEFVRQASTINVLNAVFASAAAQLENLTPAILSIGQGLRDITTVGLPAITSLSNAAGLAGVRFGNWLTAFSKSGQAAAALQAAGEILSQLGRVALNVVVVLGDVFKIAANSQSGGLLVGLDSALQTLRAFVQSKEGIAALTNVFNALGAIASGLTPVFVTLVKIIGESLGPQLLPAITSAVGALGSIVQGLAPAVAALAPGLGVAFAAMAQGFAAIGPMLPAIGKAFGDILTAIAPLLPIIVPLIVPLGLLALALSKFSALAEILGALGPALVPVLLTLLTPLSQIAEVFGELFKALQPVIDALSGVLKPVIATISAVVSVLAVALGQVLGALAGPVADLIGALGAALTPILNLLAPVLKVVIDALLPLLPVITSLVPPIVQIVVALTPLIALLAQLVSVAVTLVAPLIKVAAILLAFLVSDAIAPLLMLIAQALTLILSPLNLLIGPLQKFTDALQNVNWASVGQAIGHAFVVAWNAVLKFFEGIGKWFSELPGRIGAFLSSLPGLLVGLIKQMASNALEALGIGIGLLLFAITQLPGLIVARLLALPGQLAAFWDQLWADGKARFDSFVTTLVTGIENLGPALLNVLSGVGASIGGWFVSLWEMAKTNFAAGVDAIVSFVMSIPGRIAALPGQLLAAGERLIGALFQGIKNAAGGVGDIASSIVQKLKDLLNSVIRKINDGISKVDDILPGNLPRLPLLAQGAILRKPTIAGLAEDGAEAVIPLTKPRRAKELMDAAGLTALAGGRGTTKVGVTVLLGTREITDIVDVIVDEKLDDVADQLGAGPRAA
jgi:phage-related protein